MPDPTPPVPGVTPATPAAPNGAPPAPPVDPATAEHIKKLNAEAAENRVAAKEAREALAQANQRLTALQAAFGAPDAEAAKKQMEAQKAAADEKLAGVLRRSATVSVAAKAGARNPDAVAKLLDLSDVKVDVAKESVDADAITERVKALKKSEPYLFADAGAAPPTPPAEPNPAPPKPPMGGDGDPYEKWKAMPDGPERTAFYLDPKNHPVIVAKLQVKP